MDRFPYDFVSPKVQGDARAQTISSSMDTLAASASGTIAIGGDLSVNRIGFGTMQLHGRGAWGWPEDRENAVRVLRKALELGVNFIDTADAYGPGIGEEQIAQALYPYPSGLVIATKGGAVRNEPSHWGLDCRPERLKAACEESLRRLRVNAIDLYQLHALDRSVPFEDQVGALRDLHDEGKIRHVGLSNVGFDEVYAARKIVPIASVQNRYSLNFRRGSEILVDLCERSGIALITYFPLDSGHACANPILQQIAGKYGVSVFQIAIAWLLHRSKTILPIPGTKSVAHLEENVAAGAIALTEEDLRVLHGAA